MTDAGYRVVDEVDSADLAMASLAAATPDVVVVDLALRVGNGEELLDQIRSVHPTVRTAVFSAFVDRDADLLAAGADAVFAKPDFAPLEAWLRQQHRVGTLRGDASADTAASGARDDVADDRRDGAERRVLTHPLPQLPPRGARSPSGLEPWSTFTSAVAGLWPGDAVLGLDVLEAPVIADEWGDAGFLADFRMSIARLAGETVRDHDRLAIVPGGGVAVAVIAGTRDAARQVFERVEVLWDHAGGVGTVIGSFAHIRDDESPHDTLGRVLDRLADGETTVHHPLRLA